MVIDFWGLKKQLSLKLSISHAKCSYFDSKLALRSGIWCMYGYWFLRFEKKTILLKLSISHAKCSYFDSKLALRSGIWCMYGYWFLRFEKKTILLKLSILGEIVFFHASKTNNHTYPKYPTVGHVLIKFFIFQIWNFMEFWRLKISFWTAKMQ